jgi:hypothetical protein
MRRMRMTSVELETLLQCYYIADYNPGVQRYQSAINKLSYDGLIYMDGDRYTTTEKGAAHVKQLCSLPYPKEELRWVDANGNRIGD